jgi:hypothetical protein
MPSAVILEGPTGRKTQRSRTRYGLVALAATAALGLMLFYLFRAAPPKAPQPVDNATLDAPRLAPDDHIDVKSGDSGVVGNLTMLDRDESATTGYHAPDAAPSGRTVDNIDRQRLLSILNRD